MSKETKSGAVLVFNPTGVKMDLESNPRKKARKNPKRKAKRSNPAKRRKRSNPSHHAAPRRRARRANPSPRRVARRRSPAMPKLMDMATYTVGGALSYGVAYGIGKIPNLSVPVRLGVQAAASLGLAVGSSFVSEKVGAGAFGAFGFQLPALIMAGWSYYEATRAADKAADKLKDASKTGTKGILYPNSSAYGQSSAVAAQLRM